MTFVFAVSAGRPRSAQSRVSSRVALGVGKEVRRGDRAEGEGWISAVARRRIEKVTLEMRTVEGLPLCACRLDEREGAYPHAERLYRWFYKGPKGLLKKAYLALSHHMGRIPFPAWWSCFAANWKHRQPAGLKTKTGMNSVPAIHTWKARNRQYIDDVPPSQRPDAILKASWAKRGMGG